MVLIPVTHTDTGIAVIGSLVDFFTCVTFPALVRQCGPGITKCALDFITIGRVSGQTVL